MSQQLFRKEVFQHRSERALGEIIISRPVSHTVLTLLITVIVSLLALVLVANEYTRRETVPGYLVPTKGVVAIYPAQPGLLNELLLMEGEYVTEGEDLFKIQVDQRVNGGNYVSTEIIRELKNQKTREEGNITLLRESLATTLQRQDNIIAKLESEIEILNGLIATQQRIVEIEAQAYRRGTELFTRGAIAKADMDNIEKNFLGNEQELKDLQLSAESTSFELEEAKIARKTYAHTNKRDTADVENRISELARQIASADVEQFNVIRAPISGFVTSIVANVGQRVDASRPVLSIIPEDSSLEAHLYIPTRAIGFVQTGQTVQLRYDAFPFQRFGLYKGSINQVSSAVLMNQEVVSLSEPSYKVVASLEKQSVMAYGADVPLRPGILLTADIQLDQRSLLEWLLEPLYSLQGAL